VRGQLAGRGIVRGDMQWAHGGRGGELQKTTMVVGDGGKSVKLNAGKSKSSLAEGGPNFKGRCADDGENFAIQDQGKAN